ncbi:pilus assembly protein PilM [Candidatus Dependentiae bacterium]|nr:pilus assembly protein PilM [Candidatus Dependentiae bacterium]
MLHDILIPNKIKNSYLFTNRIVSFDITKLAIHAVLISCKGNHTIIQNNVIVSLKDYSLPTVIAAIKKILSSIGKYDEIVTAMPSNSVLFKELQLPFIGYEKLEMILAYEVESLLPFSLDQAVLDFIIMHEDKEKNISTILVAAVLKQDIEAQTTLFEKAGITLNKIFIDLFALQNLYLHGIYKAPAPLVPKKSWHLFSFFKKKKFPLAQVQTSQSFQENIDLLIDIGFEATRIMLLSSGNLQSVRIIAFGISDIAQAISKKIEAPFYDIALHLINKEQSEPYQANIAEELQKLFEQINRTLIFFENQLKSHYKKPQKIIFLGLGPLLPSFQTTAQDFFNIPCSILNIKSVFSSLHITSINNKDFPLEDITNLSVALFNKYNDNCNLLKTSAQKNETSLLIKQLLMMVALTMGCLGGLFWHSSQELQRWNHAYLSSKKELTTSIQQSMDVDLKSEKNIKDIVAKTEEKLKTERKLWFSFSKQTEQSYLEFLQDLSLQIDRESIGLELKKLTITPEMVTLVGSVKDFESLEVFKEELSELKLLQLLEKPRELSFTVKLKVKDKGQNDND